jgi:hypothetical protein
MIGRVIVLDEIAGRKAAALIVDGVLEEVLIDPADDTPLTGAIYRAVGDRPMKGMGGMFVKLPGWRDRLFAPNRWHCAGPTLVGAGDGPFRTWQGAACHHTAAV